MSERKLPRSLRQRFLLLSPFSREVWSEVLPQLKQIGDVVTVHLQGNKTIEDHAASIAKLLNERTYILGFCIGGTVALAATRAGAQFAGVILISSMPFADNTRQRRVRVGKMDRLKIKVSANSENADASYGELAAGWMLSRSSLSHGITRNLAKRVLGNMTPQMALDNHTAMLTRPDMSEYLLKFPGPLLIIVGQQDRFIVDVASIVALVAHAPTVKLIALPRCGHMIPIEMPELLMKSIEAWILTI